VAWARRRRGSRARPFFFTFLSPTPPPQSVVDDFARYADIVFSEFGSRISHWSTFNEPRTFCTLGYGVGVHAPGIKSVESAWRCVQHVLEAHAAAAKHWKAKSPNTKLCMNLDGEWGEPASPSAADAAAAQSHIDYHYGLFADPLYFGRYPDSVVKNAPAGLGTISKALAADLRASQNIYCFNGYTTRWVKAVANSTQPDGLGVVGYESLTEVDGKTIGVRAEPEWLYVVPWGFRKALAYLNKRYSPGEMAVTEFGVAAPKENDIPLPAVLDDAFRVAYYRDYIAAAVDAKRKDGVPLTAVFPWSFSDNLEWAEGYKQRFGLTYVDYPTQTRFPKASFDYVSRLWGNEPAPWPPAVAALAKIKAAG
jgi:beta-glucosidase